MMNMAPSLVFATRNENKVKEVNLILKRQNVLMGVIQSLDSIGCKDNIPETSDTIAGNAKQKASFVFDKYGLNCFAEDTGLCIDALDGKPGIMSARYAGNQRDDHDNIDLVLKNLLGDQNRRAHFMTVIALVIDGNTHLFEGKIFGSITTEPRGNSGFGYDPIFLPDGYNLTFGEMELDLKNRISHRFRALQKLIEYLKNN